MKNSIKNLSIDAQIKIQSKTLSETIQKYSAYYKITKRVIEFVICTITLLIIAIASYVDKIFNFNVLDNSDALLMGIIGIIINMYAQSEYKKLRNIPTVKNLEDQINILTNKINNLDKE